MLLFHFAVFFIAAFIFAHSWKKTVIKVWNNGQQTYNELTYFYVTVVAIGYLFFTLFLMIALVSDTFRQTSQFMEKTKIIIEIVILFKIIYGAAVIAQLVTVCIGHCQYPYARMVGTTYSCHIVVYLFALTSVFFPYVFSALSNGTLAREIIAERLLPYDYWLIGLMTLNLLGIGSLYFKIEN